jgi:hypothetical protein
MDSALNVCGLLLVTIAGGVCFTQTPRRQAKQPQRQITRYSLALLGSVLVLFPVISLADDVLLQPQLCEIDGGLSAGTKASPLGSSDQVPRVVIEKLTLSNPLTAISGEQVVTGLRNLPPALNFIPIYRHRPPPAYLPAIGN